jgi:hypothetical protein
MENSPMTIITKDLLQQQVRRHMTKCLIGLLPKVDALLPPVVLPDDNEFNTKRWM